MVSPLNLVSFTWPSRLSWGAIIAGCVAALSLHLLLTLLGLSLGIALVDPAPGQQDGPELSAAAGVAWSVSALASLWIGGWIAGRTGRRGPGNTGGIHGLLVWSVGTVVSFAAATGGTGLAVGAAARLVGRSATAAGLVGAARPDLTQPAGLLANFEEELLPPAGGVARPGEPSRARIRRELTAALQQRFTREQSPEAGGRAARDALVRVLVEAGRPPAEAEAMVSRWEDAYARARQKAESAAVLAAKRSAMLASWTVAAFALGAFFAAWGGRCGANRSAELDAAEADGVL